MEAIEKSKLVFSITEEDLQREANEKIGRNPNC